jgi:DNA invertase Pin-like site-specific DNA recombinase
MKIRAGVYTRISSDRTGEGEGVERQRTDCVDLCERQGWETVEVYEDNDISAYSGKKRKRYEQMLEDLKARRINAVVVWHPDRLHRSPKELESFIDIVEATKAKVATVTAGQWDLTTPDGRMTARIVGAVAKHESEHKGARVARKHRELAENGLPAGGRRPFGYENDRMTLRSAEAVRLREAADHILGGGTLRGLIASWNQQGVVTSSGNPWHPKTLRSLLMNHRIAGIRMHNGVAVCDAKWPAIIDRAKFDELQAVLSLPERKTNHIGTARTYLLTGGIAFCGKCSGPLSARPRSDRKRAYACLNEGCFSVRRLAEPIDDLVRDAVLHALDSPAVTRRLNKTKGDDRQTKALALDLAKYRKRVAGLETAHFIEGTLDKKRYGQLRKQLEARISETEDALARRRGQQLHVTIPDGNLRTWWDASSLDDRRVLLRLVVERVNVLPARLGQRTFDPEKIDIVWRV